MNLTFRDLRHKSSGPSSDLWVSDLWVSDLQLSALVMVMFTPANMHAAILPQRSPVLEAQCAVGIQQLERFESCSYHKIKHCIFLCRFRLEHKSYETKTFTDL